MSPLVRALHGSAFKPVSATFRQSPTPFSLWLYDHLIFLSTKWGDGATLLVSKTCASSSNVSVMGWRFTLRNWRWLYWPLMDWQTQREALTDSWTSCDRDNGRRRRRRSACFVRDRGERKREREQGLEKCKQGLGDSLQGCVVSSQSVIQNQINQPVWFCIW